MSRKHTMMKIGSSKMLTGTYLATSASMGAMMIVGSSIRLMREAIRIRVSSLSSSPV